MGADSNVIALCVGMLLPVARAPALFVATRESSVHGMPSISASAPDELHTNPKGL
jgi:hypothetical protein